MSTRTVPTTRAAVCRADTRPGRAVETVECFTQRDSSFELVAVRDCAPLLIRPIHPTDAALLADGFDRLSIQSRWFRYRTSTRELSSAELR